jgi:hypothetical protein
VFCSRASRCECRSTSGFAKRIGRSSYLRLMAWRVSPASSASRPIKSRDGCGTVQGAVATWRLRERPLRRRQVATAPCTVPEIAPLSRTRKHNLI